MTRPRFDNLDHAKRDKLLSSAAEEFSAKGYDGASLNQILERSGMSKSSLYYYFDDKADLFTTLVEQAVAFLFRQVGHFDLQELTKETFWSECEALYARAIAFAGSDAWYVKLGRMFYKLRSDPKKGAPTQRMFDMARGWVSALLARGQDVGAVRTDLPTSLLVDCAMALTEALDRWGVEHWDQLTAEERQGMAKDHIDLFRRLLGP